MNSFKYCVADVFTNERYKGNPLSVVFTDSELLAERKYIHQHTTYQFLQGVKMKHPSAIQFEVTKEGIWISGSSIIVMEGTIYK